MILIGKATPRTDQVLAQWDHGNADGVESP